MQHAQPQAVGAEVLARAVCDVEELWVDPVCQVQSECGCERDRGRCLRVLEDRVGVDLVADDMELVAAAETGDFLDRLGRLVMLVVHIPSHNHALGTYVAPSERVVRTETNCQLLFCEPPRLHDLLGQQNSLDLDPSRFRVLKGLLHRLEAHRRVKDVVKPLVLVQRLEQGRNNDRPRPCRKIHGKARVERLRNDNALAIVAESPRKSVDDGRHAGHDQDVFMADRLAGLEVGVEERGERLPEPGGSFGAGAVGEMVDWVDFALDGWSALHGVRLGGH